MHYNYRCKDCKKVFVVDAPITSKIEGRKHIVATCPHCKSKNVVKLIEKPAIVFKGTGWGKDKK